MFPASYQKLQLSPSSGGIPVPLGVRDALSAEQIYWAEQEGASDVSAVHHKAK